MSKNKSERVLRQSLLPQSVSNSEKIQAYINSVKKYFQTEFPEVVLQDDFIDSPFNFLEQIINDSLSGDVLIAASGNIKLIRLLDLNCDEYFSVMNFGDLGVLTCFDMVLDCAWEMLKKPDIEPMKAKIISYVLKTVLMRAKAYRSKNKVDSFRIKQIKVDSENSLKVALSKCNDIDCVSTTEISFREVRNDAADRLNKIAKLVAKRYKRFDISVAEGGKIAKKLIFAIVNPCSEDSREVIETLKLIQVGLNSNRNSDFKESQTEKNVTASDYKIENEKPQRPSLRIINSQRILDILRFEKGALTAQELADETNLELGTIYNIMSILGKSGLVENKPKVGYTLREKSSESSESSEIDS